MSEALIYETLYAVLEVADSILQIWLTVTFAVLVAAYVASSRISRHLYLLINFLYGFAALILTIRFVSAAFQIYYYRDLLVSSGFTPWPVPRLLSAAIGGGTLMLLIGGSIATLWFLRVARNSAVTPRPWLRNTARTAAVFVRNRKKVADLHLYSRWLVPR